MTNSITTQPVPAAPAPAPPQFPLDPANPLVWILLITTLLGNADEVINAITKLIQAITSLQTSRRDKKPHRDE